MRIRLWREGAETNDGRYVEPGGPEFGSPITPVRVVNGGYVGHVENIKREENGWVTGLLMMATDLPVRGLAAEPNFDHVEWERTEDHLVIKRARLTDVQLGQHPCWDGMVIGEVVD